MARPSSARSFWFGLLVALALVPALPSAGAQVGVPVEQCSRECTPEEVNRHEVKKGDEPVKVILYGHFEDILNMAPLNTQAPDPKREPDLNRGFLMPVVDTNSGVCAASSCADFHFKNNEFLMYSSPGLVEYLDEGWRTNQHPGLGADVPILAKEINLYWYMSAHNWPNGNSAQAPGSVATVGVMPQVGVYARLETGRFKFQGSLIAESEPARTMGGERVNMVTLPGRPDVYEFMVKMRVVRDAIPASLSENGFIVYVNPYQVAAGDSQAAQPDWRVRTGAHFPPRVVIPTERPLQTAGTSLTLYEGDLFVRWSVLASLGAYDLRDDRLSIRSTGPMPIDPEALELYVLRRAVDCDGNFKPVNMTWKMDLVQHPLADGEYELTASIPNLQGTYLLDQKVPFTVRDGVPNVPEIPSSRPVFEGTATVPGFEAGGLLGVLLILLVSGLRRRTGSG